MFAGIGWFIFEGRKVSALAVAGAATAGADSI